MQITGLPVIWTRFTVTSKESLLRNFVTALLFAGWTLIRSVSAYTYWMVGYPAFVWPIQTFVDNFTGETEHLFELGGQLGPTYYWIDHTPTLGEVPPGQVPLISSNNHLNPGVSAASYESDFAPSVVTASPVSTPLLTFQGATAVLRVAAIQTGSYGNRLTATHGSTFSGFIHSTYPSSIPGITEAMLGGKFLGGGYVLESAILPQTGQKIRIYVYDPDGQQVPAGPVAIRIIDPAEDDALALVDPALPPVVSNLSIADFFHLDWAAGDFDVIATATYATLFADTGSTLFHISTPRIVDSLYGTKADIYGNPKMDHLVFAMADFSIGVLHSDSPWLQTMNADGGQIYLQHRTNGITSTYYFQNQSGIQSPRFFVPFNPRNHSDGKSDGVNALLGLGLYPSAGYGSRYRAVAEVWDALLKPQNCTRGDILAQTLVGYPVRYWYNLTQNSGNGTTPGGVWLRVESKTPAALSDLITFNGDPLAGL